MADRTLHHKNYQGSIEVSVEDDCLHGRILFIEDLITYEGETVAELKTNFAASVEPVSYTHLTLPTSDLV